MELVDRRHAGAPPADDAAEPVPPISSEQAFAEEARQIDLRRLFHAIGERHPHIGVALSGGGIRSAAFSLGALEALGSLSFLPWVDYLSTVSGGGFAGAAFMSQIVKTGKELTSPLDYPLRDLPEAKGQAPTGIRHIRRHASYLAPGGVMSLAGLQLAATYAFGFVENLLYLVGVYGFFITSPRRSSEPLTSPSPVIPSMTPSISISSGSLGSFSSS